jgi:putative ABC transport system substrate-binding protein
MKQLKQQSRRQLLRSSLALAGVGMLSGCGSRLFPASRPSKPARVGVLVVEFSGPTTDALRQGLREQGYVEGDNLVLEPRASQGRGENIPQLVDELVRLPVDVIVTTGVAHTRPAKQATSTIPIVMALSSDPVGAGLIASLAHPGGNVTGVTDLTVELAPKRLQLLQETLPRLSRVAVLLDPTATPTMAQAGTQALGVGVERFEVRRRDELESVLQAVASNRPDALFVERHPLFTADRARIAELRSEVVFPPWLAKWPWPRLVV